MLEFILWYTLILSGVQAAVQIASENAGIRFAAFIIYTPLIITIPIYLFGNGG